MRLPLFLAGLLCTLGSTAQKTQKFYDFQWNEADIAHARFTAVTELTDSGWHRQDFYIKGPSLQMDGLPQRLPQRLRHL